MCRYLLQVQPWDEGVLVFYTTLKLFWECLWLPIPKVYCGRMGEYYELLLHLPVLRAALYSASAGMVILRAICA